MLQEYTRKCYPWTLNIVRFLCDAIGTKINWVIYILVFNYPLMVACGLMVWFSLRVREGTGFKSRTSPTCVIFTPWAGWVQFLWLGEHLQYMYTTGWSNFDKMLHILCCPKLLFDPNSKISCLYFASFLGRCRASENLACYPKISHNKKLVFEDCDRGSAFFYFYKAKN